MKIFQIVLTITLSILISGCATTAAKVEPTFYDSSSFSNLSCDEIADEMLKLTDEVNVLSAAQDERRKKDKMKTAASAVVFAPAVLLISGDGEVTQKLANAKGKLRAIGIVKNQKGCK